ncbi:hypothetical protein MRBLML1_001073 [Nocardioides sp. LML1-1-1.1]
MAGELASNRERAEDAVRTAVDNGASIVVLPELMSSGHVVEDRRQALACAESAEGPTIRSWARLAAEFDIVVVGGFCEVAQGQLFDSAALVDARGLRATYRKVHLWDHETSCFVSGDAEPPVVDTRFGRIATMVCYDLDFPEWVRLAALRGAQLLCVPTNWPAGPRQVDATPMEIVRIQASASVNRMFIAACDRAGDVPGTSWVGASTIVDVEGWPLATAWQPGGSTTTIAYAGCDLERAADKDVGPCNNIHLDRRPSLYRGLVEDPSAGSARQ